MASHAICQDCRRPLARRLHCRPARRFRSRSTIRSSTGAIPEWDCPFDLGRFKGNTSWTIGAESRVYALTGRANGMAVSTKTRLDVLLVERGLFPSRERARAYILAGRVLINEQKVDKPGTAVAG